MPPIFVINILTTQMFLLQSDIVECYIHLCLSVILLLNSESKFKISNRTEEKKEKEHSIRE